MVCLQQDRPGEEAQAGSRIGSEPFGQSILGPQRREVHGLRWTYPLGLADASAERPEWGPSVHRAKRRGLPFPRLRAGLCAHSATNACASFWQTGFLHGLQAGLLAVLTSAPKASKCCLGWPHILKFQGRAPIGTA